MTRYFFHIAYRGTKFRGWQRQKKVYSIQELLENTLAKALRLPSITIIGCGRTDAGVHASQFFFHADIAQPLPDNLIYILNKMLPGDIAFFDIIPIPDELDFPHARFDAQERIYDYFFHTYKNPFLEDSSSCYIDRNLDLEKVKKAVSLLPQYSDYKAFCRCPDKHNTTFVHIRAAQAFISQDERQVRFQIAANRFLMGQIRILVQKFLEIGTGDFSLEEFENCLSTQTRPKLLGAAHPQGLFLSKVKYNFLDLPNKSDFMNTEKLWEKI